MDKTDLSRKLGKLRDAQLTGSNVKISPFYFISLFNHYLCFRITKHLYEMLRLRRGDRKQQTSRCTLRMAKNQILA